MLRRKKQERQYPLIEPKGWRGFLAVKMCHRSGGHHYVIVNRKSISATHDQCVVTCSRCETTTAVDLILQPIRVVLWFKVPLSI